MHHFRMSILSMFHDSKGRLVVVLCDLPCFYSKNQQINPIFWSNMTLKFSKSAQNLSQTPPPPYQTESQMFRFCDRKLSQLDLWFFPNIPRRCRRLLPAVFGSANTLQSMMIKLYSSVSVNNCFNKLLLA